MNEDNLLEDLLRHATVFPGPTMDLRALSKSLEAVESQLEHARAQGTVRLQARHEGQPDLHPDDRELDLYELQVTNDQILPRVLRGGFVMALWTVFEVVTKRMAFYVGPKIGAEVSKSQFRPTKGETYLQILDRVYSRSLGIPAYPLEPQFKELDRLRGVRNALVHYNGSTSGLPDSLQGDGQRHYAALGLDYYTDLHDEFVIPNAGFLRSNYQLVADYLEPLAHRVYECVFRQ